MNTLLKLTISIVVVSIADHNGVRLDGWTIVVMAILWICFGIVDGVLACFGPDDGEKSR